MAPFDSICDRFFKRMQGARYVFKTYGSAEGSRDKTRGNRHEGHLEADIVRGRDLVARFHCSRA